MISSKRENLNCKIHEKIQKIEIYKLTFDKNKDMLINHLNSEVFRLKVILFELKKKGGD